MLRTLHKATLPAAVGSLDLYRPEWTQDMTSAALSCLPAERSSLAPVLEGIRQQYEGIFEPAGPISRGYQR